MARIVCFISTAAIFNRSALEHQVVPPRRQAKTPNNVQSAWWLGLCKFRTNGLWKNRFAELKSLEPENPVV